MEVAEEVSAAGHRLLCLQRSGDHYGVLQLVTDYVCGTGGDRGERVRELTRQLLADAMHLPCQDSARDGGRRSGVEGRAELLPPLLDVLACAAVDVREVGGEASGGPVAPGVQPLLDGEVVSRACTVAAAAATAGAVTGAGKSEVVRGPRAHFAHIHAR